MTLDVARQLSTGELGTAVIFGVLTLGGGLALLFDALRRRRYRRRARSTFERVDATVVDSALHEPATGGGRAVPNVEYEYTVGDETYASRSLWPTRSGRPDRVDRSVARRIVEDYPVGAEVIARYDPADPERVYLVDQFDATGERIEFAVAGLLLLGFVGLVAVLVGVV